VNGQPRLIHLKSESELLPKCHATDATSLTNWVRGASFPEVYVPAEVVGPITEGSVQLQLSGDDIDRLSEYKEPPPSEELRP